MRKDVPEETAPEARAELNSRERASQEVIVLEARAAFGTLWASGRKRETYYLVCIL